mmetsp:Transcript_101235/g.315505  ORF Transcript_101235/g.315505 Transcript_101235/m.315505 type:complete len:379 (+) Transcript_101235:69-1205(+)
MSIGACIAWATLFWWPQCAAVHRTVVAHDGHFRSRLAVVTPSFITHIGQWAGFLQTIARSHEDDCSFSDVVYFTVVSSDEEKAAFEKRLPINQGNSLTRNHFQSGETPRRFQIMTLDEVLISVRASEYLRAKVRVLESKMERAPEPNDKNILQSFKKMFGCLAAHGLHVDDPIAARGDICFAADSESRLLRNSICHLTTEYLKKKTVLTAPLNESSSLHIKVQEESRRLLGNKRGADFGEFYACESYHWFWEVPLVQEFIQETALVSTVPQGHIFIEETYNHFLFPRRDVWGYNFVDLHGMMKEIVGPDKFEQMLHMRPFMAPEETICAHLGALSDDEVHRLGRAFQDLGVRLMRCDFVQSPDKCQILQTYKDICISG